MHFGRCPRRSRHLIPEHVISDRLVRACIRHLQLHMLLDSMWQTPHKRAFGGQGLVLRALGFRAQALGL